MSFATPPVRTAVIPTQLVPPQIGPALLVVDDEEPLRRALVRLLRGAGYRCRAASSAAEGRAALEQEPADLVLCDVNMPGENGFALLRDISTHHPLTSVLMVTALADVRAAEPAARYGALGYVVKPFHPNEILINVANALQLRGRQLASRTSSRQLEERVESQSAELREAMSQLQLMEQTVDALSERAVLQLATVAEWRDPCTGAHLHSMSDLSSQLASAAGLGPERVDLVRVASLLHDLGKVAVPDSILMKPGPLDAAERTVMEQHSATGAAMLAGSSAEVMTVGALIAQHHHERWDGTGYPQGIRGADIPFEARIVSIADVFDALSTKRPYKEAWPLARVLDTMAAGRGTQFDPDLLDVFLDVVVPPLQGT